MIEYWKIGSLSSDFTSILNYKPAINPILTHYFIIPIFQRSKILILRRAFNLN